MIHFMEQLMNKKIISLSIITILFSYTFAKQGMSSWSGPGEVQNPDYVPRPYVPPKPKTVEKPKPKVEAPKVEPKKEETKKEEPKKEEPKKIIEKTKSAEYERSVGKLNISVDTFEADKQAIQKAIAELKVIMQKKDYNSWLNYITKDTKDFWSNPTNQKKLQTRLPKKGGKITPIRSVEDVFINFFIPARQNRMITEIRYDSSVSVRAVEIEEDGEEKSYYDFKKVDGKWLVYFITKL